MTESAQVFERVRCSHAAELRRDLVRQTHGESLQQPPTISIAHACGVDDPVRRHSGDVDAVAAGEDRRSFLAARHDERTRFDEDVGLAQPGFLAQQLEVRAAIEGVAAQLRFLPPYSPDFNPIEQAFAKLKAFLRAARPRSFDQVNALVAIALGLFTPDECRNYVRHCGYRVATP